MSPSLPLHANLEWLKKLCKERLAALRTSDPAAKLNEVQLAVAREFGFSSWRKLKDHVEQVRAELGKLATADPSDPPVAPDDPELAKLLAAVRAGETGLVAQLLQGRPALARAYGPDGQTALHEAACCNDDRLGVALLAYGADPKAKYAGSEHDALSWAVTCGSLAFARTMARLGVKPDLFCAAGMGSLADVQGFFSETGALVANASRTGSSRYAADGTRLPCPPPTPEEQVADALYIASRNAQAEVVRFLLTKNPDLGFRAYMGATALHWAHFGGSKAVIEMLQKAGMDDAARDHSLGCTPRGFGICVPASWGILPMVRNRLADDPKLVSMMDEGTSPLHEAARSGHAEIVRLLLERGADPMLANGDGRSALEIAIDRGHDQVVEMLRQARQSPGH